MHLRTFARLATFLSSSILLVTTASAKNDAVVIGDIDDMSGVYADVIG